PEDHKTGGPRKAGDEYDEACEGHRDDRREHAPIEAPLGERADDRRGRDEAAREPAVRSNATGTPGMELGDHADVPPGNTGRPRVPSATYAASVAAPRRAPSAAPTSSTANVWPVTGTGLNGRSTRSCAASATSALPATIATAAAGQVGVTTVAKSVRCPITVRDALTPASRRASCAAARRAWSRGPRERR